MPVEIVQFCWKYNLERLQSLPELQGCEAKLRMAGDKPYVTDNSNYIVDLYFQTPIKDAKAAAAAMSELTGGHLCLCLILFSPGSTFKLMVRAVSRQGSAR